MCRVVAVVFITDLQEHRVAGVFPIPFVEHPGPAILLNHTFEPFAVFADSVADVHPVAIEHIVGLAELYHMRGL
ncbi:hypothetical protein ES703_38413 [subsurface metagenome]